MYEQSAGWNMYYRELEPKKRKTVLITLWALVAVLLAVLIPLGII